MVDLSKFKKVASDKHTTTMRHEDGHELKIVHSVLSPKLRKQVDKLPMAEGGEIGSGNITDFSRKQYAEGDEVSNEELANKSQEWSPDVGYGTSANLKSGKTRPIMPSEESTTPHVEVPEAQDIEPPSIKSFKEQPEEPQASSLPQSEPTQDQDTGTQPGFGMSVTPTVPEHTGLSVMSTQGQQNPLLQRLDQLSQPNPQMTGQVQNAYQQQLNQQQAIAQSFVANKAKIDQEHQALVHDILNNHINMSDYWKQNDKGAAALGALLGGLGSGLTHLANPVPGMIQSSQDNFLKAEMSNMENPKSLLSAVQAQYGNNQNAADVMRMISNEALNAHLQKVMAPLNSANAQANAATVQMQLMQNTEQLKQQIAMRQALSSNMTADPHQKLLMMQRTGMIGDKDAEEATKELGTMDQANSLRNNLVSSFNDLNSRVLAGTFSPRDRQSAINAFAGQLEHMAEGRFNFAEAQTQMAAIMPQAGDSGETRQLKLQRLHQLVNGLMKTPTLQKYSLIPKLDIQPR